MTFPSKTDVACDCGALDRAAKDPGSPIKFDARLNEFNFIHGSGKMRIYHCPFCGGKAPESLRSTLFAQVPRAEQERLFKIVADIKNVTDVVSSLGNPDRDAPQGLVVGEPESGDDPPRAIAYHVLIYTRLSTTADLHIEVHPDGRVASHSVAGKYVGLPGDAA